MPLLFPFPFGASGTSVPTGWVPTGSVGHSWGPDGFGAVKSWGAAGAAARSWADTVENTYPAYVLGVNSSIVANEEFPMTTVEDRPLVVPPDSGYSLP